MKSSLLIIALVITFTNAASTPKRSDYECESTFYWNTKFSLCFHCPTKTLNGVVAQCTCSAENGCDSILCPDNYAYDKSTESCIPSSSYCDISCESGKCSAINGSFQCTQCFVGFINIGNTCVSTSESNCQTFSSSGQCTKCSLGYYINPGKQVNELTGGCTKCQATHCNTCTQDGEVCTECQPGYSYSGSARKCLTGESKCADVNCTTCSPASHCTACLSGFYVSSTFTCGSCSQVQNCEQCTPPGTGKSTPVCTKCENSSYILLSDGSSCVAPPSNCFEAIQFGTTTKTTCNVCANGYFRTGTAENGYTCQQCTTNEYRCKSKLDGGTETVEVPTECNAGYQPILASKTAKQNTCVSVQSIQYCLALTDYETCGLCDPTQNAISYGKKCYNCKGNSVGCIQCTVPGAGQQEGQCTECAPTYYLDSEKLVCKTCEAGAAVCTSPVFATSCQAGYMLVKKTVQKQLQQLCETNTPSHSNCSEAFITESNPVQCSACYGGYYLFKDPSKTGSVPECRQLPYPCAAVDTSQEYCSSCASNAIEYDGGCFTLAQLNCAISGSSNCKVCNYLYQNVNGFCSLCTDLTHYSCRATTSGLVGILVSIAMLALLL